MVNHERPDLQEQAAALVSQLGQYTITLKELEDSLLARLANAQVGWGRGWVWLTRPNQAAGRKLQSNQPAGYWPLRHMAAKSTSPARLCLPASHRPCHPHCVATPRP